MYVVQEAIPPYHLLFVFQIHAASNLHTVSGRAAASLMGQPETLNSENLSDPLLTNRSFTSHWCHMMIDFRTGFGPGGI